MENASRLREREKNDPRNDMKDWTPDDDPEAAMKQWKTLGYDIGDLRQLSSEAQISLRGYCSQISVCFALSQKIHTFLLDMLFVFIGPLRTLSSVLGSSIRTIPSILAVM